MMSVPILLKFFQRRSENLKPRTLRYYSHVTRSEVDLLLTDFLVTRVIFNDSNDSVTYANMRRLHVIKKFSEVSHNVFQQPFHGNLRYGRVPGLFAWTGVESKEAKSFNLNKLLGEAANSFYSCSTLTHFRGMVSPISFLQLSLFLAAFDLEQIDGFLPNTILPSTSMLSHWPSSSESPSIRFGGRFRSSSAQKKGSNPQTQLLYLRLQRDVLMPRSFK